MWYLHTEEYHSAIKKNKIMPFTATWMDLESIILSAVSKTVRRNIIWNMKGNDTNELTKLKLL